MNNFFKDHGFMKKVYAIVIPVALQNLVFSALNLVDTYMIGRLGEASIAGVSLANKYFFVLTLFFFGLGGGCAIFTSQYWGAKQYDKVKHILGEALKIGSVGAALFTFTGFFFPQWVLSLFTEDPEVISIGSRYLKTVSLCYIFSGISFIYTAVLRSTGQVKLPLIISAVSLSLNTLLNYLLIFGSLGFPRMGVQGAAIATLTSRIVETFLILILSRKFPSVAGMSVSHFSLPQGITRKFYQKVLPVLANETLWATGFAFYAAIFARIGTGAIAAFEIQQTTTTLFMVFIFGVSNASGVMIGNVIGESGIEKGHEYGRRFMLLSIIAGIITGLVIALLAPVLPEFFKVSNEVKGQARTLIYIFALVLIFKSFNITMVVGILRSGGDTVTAMLMDIFGVWGIGIPLAAIGAFIWGLPVEQVYLLASLEEIIKVLYGFYRFKSRKWINNLTLT